MKFKVLVIGDWGLGIGDWGLSNGTNTKYPIPKKQKTIPKIIQNKK